MATDPGFSASNIYTICMVSVLDWTRLVRVYIQEYFISCLQGNSGRAEANPSYLCSNRHTLISQAPQRSNGSYLKKQESSRPPFRTLHIPLLLAVQATAIRLPVQAQCLRSLDSLFPSLPEVMIDERNPPALCQAFPGFLHKFMVLKPAVKESRCETVIPAECGRFGNPGQTDFVAVSTSVVFPKDHAFQEFLHRILFIKKDLQGCP
jgi:hypothetical protein